MSTNPNSSLVYVRDENIDKWKKLGKLKLKGDFVNWAIKRYFEEYISNKREEIQEYLA